MICLCCPVKTCPDAGIVDGPGCCDLFPSPADELPQELLDEIEEEDERRMEEEEDEILIERGICPHCGKKLHSD